MTIAGRIAETEAIIAAILDGRSGWPTGLWDAALKRLEASTEVLMMTDEELVEFSAKYQQGREFLGPTSGSLMIEIARRSTLTAHQRIADAAERQSLRESG